jgi:hypothetical protein
VGGIAAETVTRKGVKGQTSSIGIAASSEVRELSASTRIDKVAAAIDDLVTDDAKSAFLGDDIVVEAGQARLGFGDDTASVDLALVRG